MDKIYKDIQGAGQGASTLAVINLGTAIIEALKILDSRITKLENCKCQSKPSSPIPPESDGPDLPVPEVQESVDDSTGDEKVSEPKVSKPKRKGRNTKN